MKDRTAALVNNLAIQTCPHHIMVADHYRPDGICRCDDPYHYHEMTTWGYTWDGKRWVSGRGSAMVCIGCGLGQKSKKGGACLECGGRLMSEV